ncbi:glycosyltransferase [Streptomyces sp. NPDC089799]|uniref:glycosyltransferase n=1 Tax=Streptomyces sp. NPDC089799 TaxID=3155066 RepID=UPI00342459C0
MRIGLLTDGGSRQWCDRLVRGLPQHEFTLYAQPRGGADDGRRGLRRRDRARFASAFRLLAGAICATPDPGAGADAGGRANAGDRADAGPGHGRAFAGGLYALAELAQEQGGLSAALRSEDALRALEAGCRAPGAHRAVQGAGAADLADAAAALERALRPLSLDWYESLGAADVVHAAAGGTAALPGLVAKRFCGVPLLVTEYGVQLRAHCLEQSGTRAVRALTGGFQARLAAELYDRADLLTPGNAHVRRWQERCGAPRVRVRTVYPGMEADRFAGVGEAELAGADPVTLVWVGRVEPAKDLIGLLHAFAEVRRAEPAARLRIFCTNPTATTATTAPTATAAPTAVAAQSAPSAPADSRYLADCRALAAQLFPDEAADRVSAGENPVSFEEVGGPYAPSVAEAYATGRVAVSSSAVEGFPTTLVEAMFCGRATVSTDAGAVFEVIGGTGLVVPTRNPRALAEACVSLLRDRERAALLGAAARARALELFAAERTVEAFGEMYVDLIAAAGGSTGRTGRWEVPFAVPAEARVPGHWTTPSRVAEAPV